MYTKGETAGTWVYIHEGREPVALVHPDHVDKFLASNAMYEALKELVEILDTVEGQQDTDSFTSAPAREALAKVDNPSARQNDD